MTQSSKSASKIITLDQLKSKLQVDRQIVFTHGAFDMLHRGHTALLHESKKLGGWLVVGVDHDSSVSVYKKSTTLFHQEYRVHMISQLDYVDYVLPMTQVEKPEDFDYYYMKLYLLLRPNIITFGQNFPFVERVDEKCRLVGIQVRQITHKWSTDISTTQCAADLMKDYIKADIAQYEKKTD